MTLLELKQRRFDLYNLFVRELIRLNLINITNINKYLSRDLTGLLIFENTSQGHKFWMEINRKRFPELQKSYSIESINPLKIKLDKDLDFGMMSEMKI